MKNDRRLSSVRTDPLADDRCADPDIRSAIDKIARDYFADVVVITEFILLMGMFRIVFAGVTPEFRFSGMCGLNFHLRLDGFQEVYCMIAAFIWVMTTLISGNILNIITTETDTMRLCCPPWGRRWGLFMSADLFTTFLFYQIITIDLRGHCP